MPMSVGVPNVQSFTRSRVRQPTSQQQAEAWVAELACTGEALRDFAPRKGVTAGCGAYLRKKLSSQKAVGTRLLPVEVVPSPQPVVTFAPTSRAEFQRAPPGAVRAHKG